LSSRGLITGIGEVFAHQCAPFAGIPSITAQ
jgi:hypothetical protein